MKFRTRKINLKQKAQMIKLRKTNLNVSEIARIFDVTSSSVQYHTNNKYQKMQKEKARKRFRGKTIAQRRKMKKQNRKYQRVYQHERYKQDPLFRARIIKQIMESQKRIKKERLKKGLCEKCGKKNMTPKFKNCKKCRKKIRKIPSYMRRKNKNGK